MYNVQLKYIELCNRICNNWIKKTNIWDEYFMKHKSLWYIFFFFLITSTINACSPSLTTTTIPVLQTETSSPPIQSTPTISPSTLARLEPTSGTYFGVNLDWAKDSPAAFDQRLGHHAAVYVQFFRFPLGEADLASLDKTVKAISDVGGMMMITLEPFDGLVAVTPEVATALADRLAEVNVRGILTFVRFAHEMNGSWYPWSQQPATYVKAFRIVADAIHSRAPQSAMIWAPSYGGGYPFKGGQFVAKPENTDFGLLDTNHDGQLDMNDDPYRPYYPGDEAVDWVGMSIYHWGSTYPWGENEIPEAGKFLAQLTGNYNGLGGDDRTLPDFYEIYYKGHGKPVAIPETAAFFDPARSGSTQVVLKQSWWRQVLDRALLVAYPGIKMINWFEWAKSESEVGGALVDWRALGSPAVAEQFRADLPLDRLIFSP